MVDRVEALHAAFAEEEVWDLDERVHGVRPSDPPVDLPRLEQRVPVAVPASTQVIITPEEASPDGSAAADLRDLLCYGLGAVSASAVADEDVPFRANELNSAFSAYKYDLFIALKSIQVLEFRRAALGAMLQSRRRRADLMRRALKTDQ